MRQFENQIFRQLEKGGKLQYIIRNVYGDSLVKKMHWHTSSRCFWNIIPTPFISPEAIPLRQNSSRLGMSPLLRSSCWNKYITHSPIIVTINLLAPPKFLYSQK